MEFLLFPMNNERSFTMDKGIGVVIIYNILYVFYIKLNSITVLTIFIKRAKK